MFDGKMLREATGTPMRSTERAKRRLALADPDPLTLANLTTKSLTRMRRGGGAVMPAAPHNARQCPGGAPLPFGIFACPRHPSGSARRKARNAGRHLHPSP